eukprot:scaffold24227_cov30-Tisochrysis_lutea.AAC.5
MRGNLTLVPRKKLGFGPPDINKSFFHLSLPRHLYPLSGRLGHRARPRAEYRRIKSRTSALRARRANNY